MRPLVQLGKYRLLERLDVGGTAEVFLALDPGGGLVAVKRLLPTLAEGGDFVEMFLEEARLGATLDHPGIVRVLGAGREETGWFIALEWVPGRDLRAVLARLGGLGRRLPPGLAAHVARQVCGALEHVHRSRGGDGRPLGLAHRDVTPRNVLCSWAGAVKLADFGIARGAGPAGASGRAAAGEPDRGGGRPAGPGSDVLALAAVLREMLTGERLPAEAAGAPPRWRSSPAVPPALDAAVLGALAPRPAAPAASAADLARALEPFADPQGERSLSGLLGELFPEERRRDQERARGRR